MGFADKIARVCGLMYVLLSIIHVCGHAGNGNIFVALIIIIFSIRKSKAQKKKRKRKRIEKKRKIIVDM